MSGEEEVNVDTRQRSNKVRKNNRDIEERKRVFMYLFSLFNFSKLILQFLDGNGIENHDKDDFLSYFYPKAEENFEKLNILNKYMKMTLCRLHKMT